MNERLYYLGFSVFPGIGYARFQKLLKKFQTAEQAWHAPVGLLIESGIPKALSVEFDTFRKTISLTDYEQDLKQKKIEYITLTDSLFPQKLKDLNRVPFVLYTKGNQELLSDDSFAVVGTRMVTVYGREVTRMFTSVLVEKGLVIVSGLALGVDACAHETALNLSGKTIAVLGCGVDCPTPLENAKLYENILAKKGLIVSDIPPSVGPNKGSFLARNRIIAGLSLGVLVTEGAEDSGALTTAEYGFQLKRPVFAVPGPITSSLSKGPYKLISKGARLVINPQEIIESITSNRAGSIKSEKSIKSIKGFTKEEKMILNFLEKEAMHFDELVRKTGIPSSKLGSLLTLMEVKGILKNAGSIFSIVYM